ncbi:MAG TPA: hypothetical protein VMS98_07975 [Thermoanaerobaculia bacterium]|nr:hypothetical protein [Thermoanaerobaculia bacterium]
MNVRPAAALLTLFLSSGAVILIGSFDRQTGERMLTEEAFIEEASMILWFGAAAVCGLIAVRTPSARVDFLLLGHVWIWAALRELGINPVHDLPMRLEYSLILTSVAAALLTAAVLLGVFRWQRVFRNAWKSGEPWTRDAIWWAGLMAVGRVAENLHGWTPNRDARFAYSAIEESAEMAAPFLTVMTLSCFLIRRPARHFEPKSVSSRSVEETSSSLQSL